jgi:hypothetical protein
MYGAAFIGAHPAHRRIVLAPQIVKIQTVVGQAMHQRRTSYVRGAQVPPEADRSNNGLTTPKELNLSSSKILYKK